MVQALEEPFFNDDPGNINSDCEELGIDNAGRAEKVVTSPEVDETPAEAPPIAVEAKDQRGDPTSVAVDQPAPGSTALDREGEEHREESVAVSAKEKEEKGQKAEVPDDEPSKKIPGDDDKAVELP